MLNLDQMQSPKQMEHVNWQEMLLFNFHITPWNKQHLYWGKKKVDVSMKDLKYFISFIESCALTWSKKISFQEWGLQFLRITCKPYL